MDVLSYQSKLTNVKLTMTIAAINYLEKVNAKVIKPIHRYYLRHAGNKRRARVINGVTIFIVDRRQQYAERRRRLEEYVETKSGWEHLECNKRQVKL